MKLIKTTILSNIIVFFFIIPVFSFADYIYIPMDSSQKNHLKAYGIAFWVLEKELEVDWLLNYNGGSFMIRETETIKS